MSGTILLADDSLTIQKVVELTFADTDYRVVAVSSGDDLLDRLTDSRPDLIICDVIMPGKDGYEVCQQIKSSSEWLHLPVILLTGTFEPFDRDRAIAAGCSEIITKPFEARKLVDTVERLIGGADIQTPEASLSAADNGEAWPEEPTPIDVPAVADPEDFGTQLTAPKVDDDGIEFTTSGFAEMEAAGRSPDDPSNDVAADDGVEYEFTNAEAKAETAEVTPPPPMDPPMDPPPPSIDPSAQTVRIDISSLDDYPEDDEPDLETPVDDEVPATVAVDPSKFAPVVPEESAPEPFPSPQDEPFEAPPEATTDEIVEDGFTDEPSMADTSPVEPPSDDDESPDENSDDGAFKLTDDDIDRIARRVIELASDRLEQIAWEIVPDMAEVVVRQRIRELEAESEAASTDTVQ
jgi:CheY-like chemotaxis protein